jgi:hypothetical protein
VVDALPGSRAIAVGPDPGDPVWRALHEDTRGRVTAIGPDPDLSAWHAAADLYLEGFPIGSYTALLEVALAGRAFVRKPLLVAESVLPVDRGALADFAPPVSPADWTATAIALAGDAARCEAMGAKARASVLAVHCGDGWTRALAALVEALPAGHRVDARPAPAPAPPELARYWTTYHRARSRQSPLDYARAAAAAQGLRVRVDAALVDEAGRGR